jgi:uncharacterized protein
MKSHFQNEPKTLLMQEIILEKLKTIEHQFNVKILHACESGSRAWGFASPDSDWDVRFIYVHTKEDYLTIDEQRDVIELPINDELDISGWELRKALRLLRKSNGPLCEWIQSPIVYKSDEIFLKEVRNLMNQYFSPRPMAHHYLSMTNSVMKGHLSGDQVKLKKYFYALRPILACRWIIDKNEVPPMEFGKLRKLLDPTLNGIVDDLLKRKSKADEKATISPVRELHAWLEKQIEYCERNVPQKEYNGDNETLNEFFRKHIA